MRPPGIWGLLTIYSRQDQKEISNEFWYRLSAAPDLSTWGGVAACNALYTPIATALGLVTTTRTTFLGANLIVNNGAGSIGFDYYSSYAGTLTANPLPEDVCVLVQKDCGSFLPGSQGRWYFSGGSQGMATGSYLTPAGLTAWETLGTTLNTNVVDQGITYEAAHFSPKQGALLLIQAPSVVALLATRRRRRYRF